MSDLSQLITNQSNPLYLFTGGIRCNEVYQPSVITVNTGTSETSSQPLVIGCIGNQDPNSVTGRSFQLYTYQKAWFCSNSNSGLTVGTGFQYIPILQSQTIGQNIGAVASNTITLPVGGYYKMNVSYTKAYTAGTVETVATTGLRLNNTTNTAYLTVNNSSAVAGLYVVSFSVIINVGAGSVFGVFYNTNTSAGQIQLSDLSFSGEIVSSS